MTGVARRVAWSIVAVWAALAAGVVLGGGKKMSAEAKMFAASAEYDHFMGLGLTSYMLAAVAHAAL